MANPFTKAFRYFAAKTDETLEAHKDPKVEIKMAADQAKKDHARLSASAANIIGQHRQLALTAEKKAQEVETLNAQVRQALNRAETSTSPAEKADLTAHAETLATRLVSAESELQALDSQEQAAGNAAAEAKRQVQMSQQNLSTLSQQIDRLNMQVDAVQMQEKTNAAMDGMNSPYNSGNTPTLGEIGAKIEGRYALATGQVELAGVQNHTAVIEGQQAIADASASARLQQIRAQMDSGADAGDNDLLKRIR